MLAAQTIQMPLRVLERSFLPREHRALGLLLIPVAMVGLAFRSNPSELALSVAAASVFLALEPILVMLGRRGEESQTADSDRAWVRLLVLAVVAGASAGMGIVLATVDA